MNRDRVIQLVAVGVIVAGLLLSALIAPLIHSQRRELNISGTINDKQLPPQYALATAALGSFRGIAIDALWYRTEHLQQAGKFYEANTLADWITTLQPRFPQVWVFQSWNMAYNISVDTHTPQERWNWVSKGIRLLRSRGLVYNPQSVMLYRELGWFFMHKIGMSTDDMHWYYKLQLAEKWQEILGAPTEAADTRQVLARFAPVANMAEKYFRFDQPTRKVYAELTDLIKAHPDLKTDLKMMQEMAASDLLPLVKKDLARWRTAHPDMIASLKKIQSQVKAQVVRSQRNPVSMFLQDYPQARPVVARLRAIGLNLDLSSLRQIGRVRMLARYVYRKALLANVDKILPPIGRKILSLDLHPPTAAGLIDTLNFMRAKALTKDFNMDPVFMYQLMQKYGPLDWRHPDAQAVYWYAMGVERSHSLGASPNFDVLNTDRGVVHSLQALMHQGKIIFNPIQQRIDLLPDTRFVASYEKAMYGAEARARARGISESSLDSFKTGYRHFLERALVICYLYGSDKQAQTYYNKLHTQFADSRYNQQSRAYDLPIENLVMKLIHRDLEERSVSRAFIGAMLQRGIMQGLANAKPNIYHHFQDVAQAAYRQYQKKQNYATPGAPRNRQALPPFGEVVVDTYVQLMRQPRVPLLERSRIYYNTPISLRRRAYPQFINDVTRQTRQRGIDTDRAFPPPAGMSHERIKPRKPNALGGATIERH